MAKKKYEKVRDITYVDQQGNVVRQKLTGQTGGSKAPAMAEVKGPSVGDNLAYLGKAAKTGVGSGLLTVPLSTLQETEESLEKGKKIKNVGDVVSTIGDSLNAVHEITNPDILGNAKEFIGKAIKTVKDKDKDVVTKGAELLKEGVSTAAKNTGATPPKADAGLALVGAVNPDIAKGVKGARKAINKPIDKMQEDLAKAGQDKSGLMKTVAAGINTAGNMAPSLAASVITKNPNIGRIAMANMVKGQTTEQALKEGKTLEEANEIGNLGALAAVGTEAMTGGVDLLGKGALDDVAGNVVNKYVKNPVANFAVRKAGGLMGENLEESAENIIDKAIARGSGDKSAKITGEDIVGPWGPTTISSLLMNSLGGSYTPQAYRQYLVDNKIPSLNDAEKNALITATQKRKTGQPLDQNDIAAINVINNKQIDPEVQMQNEVNQIQQAVQNGEMSIQDANNVLQSINNEMQQNQDVYSKPMTEQEANNYYNDYSESLKNIKAPQEKEGIFRNKETRMGEQLVQENNVSDRKTNAIQYDNPEIKKYYKDAAKIIGAEASWADDAKTEGGLALLDEGTQYERYKRFGGSNGFMGGDLGTFARENHLTAKQVEKAADDIVADNGRENNANAKKLEKVIDQRLRNGYSTMYGDEFAPNQEYIEDMDTIAFNKQTQEANEALTKENVPATKEDNVITVKNDNLQDIPKDKIKGENTGISIGDKQVQVQIPVDSKPNKLGQYIPKDGFTKAEKGKLGNSKFYRNVTERADFIRDEVRQKVQEDDYIKHYKKVTNEESMQQAFNDLNTRGTEAIADFFNNDKELTSVDTAMGWLLIEQSQENGDYKFANQVLRKMRDNATKIGQAEQMYNYYARLTPEGMYRWCGDQLLRAEEIFEKGKTKKWIDNNKDRWQLNGAETEFINDQMKRVEELNNMNDNDMTTIDVKGKQKQVTVERAKQVEIAKIQAMIENKIPPKKGQALNAWMRISMLGNLKTIGTRNPLGNIALRPINDVGDFFGSMVDYAISKKTGVRTKGNFNAKAQAKGIAKGTSETIQDAKLGISTKNAKGNRFEIDQGKSFNERHGGVAKALNPLAKAGNKADSAVSFLLDLGDRPFYEATYEQSLENQMRLNGIENREDVPDWMKKIAEQEGLERTYQDDNNYTSAVIDIRNAMNKFNVKGYGLGDVIIPFAKTPANLTKAIVDYSPAGFVSAITKGKELRTSIENGQFTPEMQHKFVNQLGKATAGTILYAIGAGLANSGLITGGADEDKDVADFMKNTLGIQPYSIKIGDKTYTYDWAQPLASGLAIPADIKKTLEDAKEGEVDLEYIIHKSFGTAGAVLLEQSFLQGIKDVLGGYGDPIDNLMSELEGLPARAIPTLFQQIITYLDGTKRMSYGNKGIQNAISQAQAKTPWAKDLPVYRNSMGKEIKMYGGKNNFFNVFINPANYSEGNASDSAKEIYEVYKATNKKEILPRLVANDMKNEDGTKLSNKQKSDFLKISGDIIEENVDSLLYNEEYNSMSDEDKAETIKSIVDYAYNKARKDITGHELSSTYKKAEKAEDSGYAIADYYISKNINKTTRTTSSSDRNRYQELSDKGIDGRTFDDFKAFVSTARGESRTGGPTKKQKIISYIQDLPLTAQQKQDLYDDYIENTGMFQYYK